MAATVANTKKSNCKNGPTNGPTIHTMLELCKHREGGKTIETYLCLKREL